MSSRTELHLRDILESAQIIREYLDGETLESYASDRKLQDAVVRRLQIVSEAVFRLQDQAAILCPSVDWRDIRGLGNFIRHEYEKVSDERIWDKIHNRLPEIEVAVSEALLKLQQSKEDPC